MSLHEIAVPEALGRMLLTRSRPELDKATRLARSVGAKPSEIDWVRGLWTRQQSCICSHHHAVHFADGSAVCAVSDCTCAQYEEASA